METLTVLEILKNFRSAWHWSKTNMRKMEPWNFWICVNTCDSVSDFTVPVNMGIAHV